MNTLWVKKVQGGQKYVICTSIIIFLLIHCRRYTSTNLHKELKPSFSYILHGKAIDNCMIQYFGKLSLPAVRKSSLPGGRRKNVLRIAKLMKISTLGNFAYRPPCFSITLSKVWMPERSGLLSRLFFHTCPAWKAARKACNHKVLARRDILNIPTFNEHMFPCMIAAFSSSEPHTAYTARRRSALSEVK